MLSNQVNTSRCTASNVCFHIKCLSKSFDCIFENCVKRFYICCCHRSMPLIYSTLCMCCCRLQFAMYTRSCNMDVCVVLYGSMNAKKVASNVLSKDFASNFFYLLASIFWSARWHKSCKIDTQTDKTSTIFHEQSIEW